MIKNIRKIDSAILRAESVLLVLAVGLMTLMAFGEVMSKLIADYPIQWMEMAVRYLVLWVTFIGGSVATASGRHITIDIAARYLQPRGRAIAVATTSSFAVGILMVLFFVSITYLRMKFANNNIAFTIRSLGMVLPVRSYIALSVVPPALLAMAWHFFVITMEAILDPGSLPTEQDEAVS